MKKLDSPIFNPNTVRRAFRGNAKQASDRWTENQKKRLQNAPRTGKTVVVKIKGRSVRHQRSNRGERPAQLSGDLINSYQSKRTGEYSAESAPDVVYANRLQHDFDRVIVSDPDLTEAQEILDEESENTIRSLI